jgi:Ala-tRNA(Pro) deacylase
MNVESYGGPERGQEASMDGFQRIQAYLRAHHVDFEVQRHRRAFTAQDVAATEHLSGRQMAKAVMVVADGKLRMLVLPASFRVDEERAASALNAHHVRLAEEGDFTSVFLDCDVGAMPPFGNLYGMPVCVDRVLAEEEAITFQAGTHTQTISMKYADFERLVGPTVADLALHPLTRHS